MAAARIDLKREVPLQPGWLDAQHADPCLLYPILGIVRERERPRERRKIELAEPDRLQLAARRQQILHECLGHSKSQLLACMRDDVDRPGLLCIGEHGLAGRANAARIKRSPSNSVEVVGRPSR